MAQSRQYHVKYHINQCPSLWDLMLGLLDNQRECPRTVTIHWSGTSGGDRSGSTDTRGMHIEISLYGLEKVFDHRHEWLFKAVIVLKGFKPGAAPIMEIPQLHHGARITGLLDHHTRMGHFSFVG